MLENISYSDSTSLLYSGDVKKIVGDKQAVI